ncbi:hypothetical protein HMN09_00667800 [Mycena chlorophos]|uniref:FAD/NAD(P)-binding domain-containing protein n=1 Tax=Mycena chlorophos TaxID=658473 RepID=A0A8H6T2E1_MYCCL|nr:hypothetical protein HMN09_00667800 [Mycena chlorophos]
MFSAILLTPFIGYLVLLAVWHILRRRLLATVIGVDDLPRLQKTRPVEDKIDGTAVVCGGRYAHEHVLAVGLTVLRSIAGLLAARICHAHFRKVLIVEPEVWVATEDARTVNGWNGGEPRTRVMQWNSQHSTQPYLFSGMNHLFPKLEDECENAHIRIEPHNVRFHLSGRPWRVPSNLLKSLYVTRSALEKLIRRLVLDKDLYPNIETMTGTVIDIILDLADESRIAKVAVRDEQGAIREIAAALVADCTGPARAGMKWLARHGYEDIGRLKVSIDQKLHYSTMSFRLDEKFHSRLPLPEEQKRARSIYACIEDANEKTTNRGKAFFVVSMKEQSTLSAFAGHYGSARAQPSTVEELKAYVEDLHTVQPIPNWLLQTIDMLHEIEDTALVSLVKPPPTTYVRYHLANILPANFVALGDSVMTINPAFGEGCTKALRCAMALHKVLLSRNARKTIPESFSADFFREQRVRTEWMWKNTRTQDYAFPTTVPIEGESLASGRFMRWYLTGLQRLATMDAQAGTAIYDAVCGFASPIDALHPHLLAKVLWSSVTCRKGWS